MVKPQCVLAHVWMVVAGCQLWASRKSQSRDDKPILTDRGLAQHFELWLLVSGVMCPFGVGV